ncbi:MAG: hypothetical protein RML12_05575 [Xanthomonadales bacterium]|nr:hypothetical protein [Xanthomonadales bacterium]
MIELADDRIGRLLARQAARHGFRAHAQVLEVQGLCAACVATPGGP